jgi:hypothetical protein
MPGEFLGSFAKFFTNLTTSQRQELERAFGDMQNSKELTSLDESLRLLRRKPDQMLPIPQLTVTNTLRGGTVSWIALTDQRINFYEAQVSVFSNFSAFSTVTTFGTDLSLEGLDSEKFVKVRGVRRDGTTSPWSDVIAVTPQLFEVRAHTAEAFYLRLEALTVHEVLGGPGSELEFTPTNPDGTSMVWGFISGYVDPAVAFYGDAAVQARVMVSVITPDGAIESDTEYLRISFGEHYNSISIGPFPVEHPAEGYSLAVRIDAFDLTTTEGGGPRHENATLLEWTHLNVLEVGLDG